MTEHLIEEIYQGISYYVGAGYAMALSTRANGTAGYIVILDQTGKEVITVDKKLIDDDRLIEDYEILSEHTSMAVIAKDEENNDVESLINVWSSSPKIIPLEPIKEGIREALLEKVKSEE